MSGTSSLSATGTTLAKVGRRVRSVRPSGRTSQTSTQRSLSKRAAAINQKWKRLRTPGRLVSADDLAEVWLRDKGRCVYCDIEVDLRLASFDHVVPFSKGGANDPSNLVTSCITDQRGKYTATDEEYRAYRVLVRHCRSCGLAFRPRRADVARGYGWYHSRSCAAKAAHP